MKKKKENLPVPFPEVDLLPSKVFLPAEGADNSPEKYNDKEAVLQVSHIAHIKKVIVYNNHLFSSSKDRICRWDIESALLIREINWPSADITTISTACGYLYTGHEDGSVNLLDLKEYKIIHSYKDHSKNILSLIYDQSDESIYSCSEDGMIIKYSINNKDLLYFIEPYIDHEKGNDKTISSMGCLIHDDYLYSYSVYGKVKKYDKISGEYICELAEDSNFITIKDNKLICGLRSMIFSDDSSSVSTWDLETGLLIDKKHLKGDVYFIEDSTPDAHCNIVYINNDLFVLFNINELSVVSEFYYHTDYSVFSIARIGNLVLFPDKNKVIGFDISAGKVVKEFSSVNKFIPVLPVHLSADKFMLLITDSKPSIISIDTTGRDVVNTFTSPEIVTCNQYVYIREKDDNIVKIYNQEMKLAGRVKLDMPGILIAATDRYLFYSESDNFNGKRSFYKFDIRSGKTEGSFYGKGGISFIKIYNDYIYTIGTNAEAIEKKYDLLFNDPWIREGSMGGVYVMGEDNAIIQRWHVETGEYNVVFRINEWPGELYGFEIIDNIAYISCKKYGISKWDLNSGEYIESLNFLSRKGYRLAAGCDSKLIMAYYYNNEVLFISSHSGNLICSFMMLNASDYTFYTPDNRFFCTSPEILQVKEKKLTPHGFTEELITKPFEKYAKSLRFIVDIDDIFQIIGKEIDKEN